MSGLQTGFRVPPQRLEDIRRLAWNARKAFGLPHGKIDLERFIERLIEHGITPDVFDGADAPVGHNIEACWVPETATLYIRDTVYADACRGGTRAMFTICHELGHIFLAHRRTINREMPGVAIPVYANSEWQANAFAAEFSMPLPLMNHFDLWTPHSLASALGVSLQAAEIRIQKLAEEVARQKK